MNLRNWARRLLLGFVLVTLGFTWGRRTAPSPEAAAPADDPAAEGATQLVVYAAHMTFRCFECVQIELLARELLEEEFPDYLEDGRIRFAVVDYMQDEPFAARYDISSSTLVLARLEDGEEIRFERLDQVWSHVRNREAFMNYVRNALWEHLSAMGEGPK